MCRTSIELQRHAVALCVAAAAAQPALQWRHSLPGWKVSWKWDPSWTSAACFLFVPIFSGLVSWSSCCFSRNTALIWVNITNVPVIESCWYGVCTFSCRGLHLWVISRSRTWKTPCLLSGNATCHHRGGDITSTPLTMVRVNSKEKQYIVLNWHQFCKTPKSFQMWRNNGTFVSYAMLA